MPKKAAISVLVVTLDDVQLALPLIKTRNPWLLFLQGGKGGVEENHVMFYKAPTKGAEFERVGLVVKSAMIRKGTFAYHAVLLDCVPWLALYEISEKDMAVDQMVKGSFRGRVKKALETRQVCALIILSC